MQDPLFERAQAIINSDDEMVKILIETINKANIDLGVKINLHELIKTIFLLPFKHAAFKGGGVKGTAYVGVIRVLERFGLLNQFETMIGASAGGLTAAFLGLGVTPEQIDQILSSFTADEVLDGKMLIAKLQTFARSHGIDTGEGLKAWFQGYLGQLNINLDITFAEHQREVDAGVANKKEIILIGTDITKGRRLVFSAKTTPHLKIADGVRITSSIPGFFTPIYVELDDEDQIIFDTDSDGRKHLRCSDTPDSTNPRQVCLVDGGLIDNIGNDLKNVMGIQNSLVAVFYLLKMKELHPEEQIRLDQELSERCREFLEKNQEHNLGKRERLKNKAKSGLAKIKMTFDNDEKLKHEHDAARRALKETARMAREAELAVKKQQALVEQRSLSTSVKKVSLFRSLKDKISQVLGTVRKGQERNLEHGVAFIDPVPDFSTTDFDKVQIQPIKEMAIANGMRGAIAMLVAEALPIYLQRQQEKSEPSDEIVVQRFPTEIMSAHAEVLQLAPARMQLFMNKRATSVYWLDGKLQMACPIEKLAKLKKCATEYFRYGFADAITIHTEGEQAFLTLQIKSEHLQAKHEKWVGRLGNVRSNAFHQLDETTLQLDFRQTLRDESVFTDPAFSTELLNRMKANGL